jgi:transmembrane sensor
MLGRYLAGECTESEAAVVRRFLMARPDAARALSTYLAHLDGDASQPPVPDDDSSWAALSARIHAEGAVRNAPALSTVPRAPAHHRHFVLLPEHTSRPWWRGGWAIALAASAAAAVIIAVQRPQPAAVPDVPKPRIYETQAAERAEIVLTDGTHITLAPESRLRVAAEFGDERREVHLEGEAYFNVVHDDAKPFTVYAGSAAAHDIGTAFAVRSYAKDSAVQIIVREGSVAMSGVGPLHAGDVGLLENDGTSSLRHRADVAAMLGWLDGKLSYADAPLARVVDDLHRWQGAEIVIRDPSLASLPFTGEMAGLSTRSSLDLVARTLGLELARDGERFILAADPGRKRRQ